MASAIWNAQVTDTGSEDLLATHSRSSKGYKQINFGKLREGIFTNRIQTAFTVTSLNSNLQQQKQLSPTIHFTSLQGKLQTTGLYGYLTALAGQVQPVHSFQNMTSHLQFNVPRSVHEMLPVCGYQLLRSIQGHPRPAISMMYNQPHAACLMSIPSHMRRSCSPNSSQHNQRWQWLLIILTEKRINLKSPFTTFLPKCVVRGIFLWIYALFFQYILLKSCLIIS